MTVGECRSRVGEALQRRRIVTRHGEKSLPEGRDIDW